MNLDPGSVAGVAGGTLSIATVVWWLVQRAIRRGDKAEEQLNREQRIELAKLRERVESGLASHRDQLEALKRTIVEHDTRLAFREGRYGTEPLTNPGRKLTPEELSRLRQAAAERNEAE